MDDLVWGVLFELDDSEKPNLDLAEGLGHGYEETEVRVLDPAGQPYDCIMYVASDKHKIQALRPYSWYLRFVLEGARQHNLPADYVSMIETIEAIEDPDSDRDAKNRQIQCN